MNALQINKIAFQTEKEEIYIDSETVAKGFEIQHESLVSSIRKHFKSPDLKSDLVKQSGSGQIKIVYLLNERQVMILPAICKPTEKTIAFQTLLVDSFIEARKQLSKKQKYEMPYHIRRYIDNSNKIPPTHFSMLNEMIFCLVAPLERMGYILPETLMPDISMGRMFCGFMRSKGIETDSLPTYKHVFNDKRRKPVKAKLYPLEILLDFRNYLLNVWLKQHSVKYFKQREPEIIDYLEQLVIETKEKSVLK